MINNTTAAIRKLKLKILSVASHVVIVFESWGWGGGRSTHPKKKGKFASHENPNP